MEESSATQVLSGDLEECPRLVCVEYPGYLGGTASIGKVIDTLGGSQELNKTLREKSKFLKLRFRPEDPFCHPIFADHALSSNLLLKVTRTTRRKRKSDSKKRREQEEVAGGGHPHEEQSFRAEVVGTVTAAYRFNGMADYQYLPPPAAVYRERKTGIHLLDGGPEELYLPPVLFARVDRPHDYQYRANPAAKSSKDKAKRNAANTLVTTISWTDPTPPELPEVQQDPDETVQALLALFKERPIWVMAALKANLPSSHWPKLKRALILVSYHFAKGPWLRARIRRGYDPRKRENISSRMYQVVDFRVDSELHTKISKFSRGRRGKGPTPVRKHKDLARDMINMFNEEKEVSEEEEGLAKLEYRFLVPPLQRQTSYQLCDIEDEDVQELLKTEPCNREPDVCILFFLLSSFFTNTNQSKYGWFSKLTLDSIRYTMQQKLLRLANDAEKSAAKDGTGRPQRLLRLRPASASAATLNRNWPEATIVDHSSPTSSKEKEKEKEEEKQHDDVDDTEERLRLLRGILTGESMVDPFDILEEDEEEEDEEDDDEEGEEDADEEDDDDEESEEEEEEEEA
ncbi:General transcription factor 3C polypeptide 5 [Balamuthia mandrillaris]